jgi:4-azaleucine resistance transporter AzlC
MPRAAHRRAFLQGMRDGAPFLIVIVPFGLLFGVVAREAGWDMAEILGMSVLVIAGASQFTALQLMAHEAPTFVVILAATAVNLRHAMYSASLAPHLGRLPVWRRALVAYCLVDQTYGVAINRYAVAPAMSAGEKAAFFLGTATGTCSCWYAASVAGALLGRGLPPALALDFAVPVAFIALFAPALRSPPHLVAAVVSVVVALTLSGPPLRARTHDRRALGHAGRGRGRGARGAAAVSEVWTVILGLGLATFLIRFSFLGLIGDRALPEWALRLLRYVSVAVMPGLVAPLVVWPDAAGGAPEPARMTAAAAALAFGAATRSVLGAIGAGMAALYLALWAFGS